MTSCARLNEGAVPPIVPSNDLLVVLRIDARPAEDVPYSQN